MQQGAKANYSGKTFEAKVKSLLQENNHKPSTPPRYKSLWSSRGQADIYLEESDTQIELKFQNVPGTADQKAFTEIYNAAKTNKCAHYILVLGGEHWKKGRGHSIYINAKEFAEAASQPIGREAFSLNGAKKLSVMLDSEFEEWANE